MSYWTYSDLFEEPGPPTAPFQGGFGLVNPEGIRKPAYFAYKYLHALQGKTLLTNDPQAILSTKDGSFAGVIWDFEQPQQETSNRSFFTKVIPSHSVAPVKFELSNFLPNTAYRLLVYRTGYHANDAYTAYLEMGSPKDLNSTQIKLLNDRTNDVPETDKVMRSGSSGIVEFTLPMNSNDTVLVTLVPTV